VAQHVNQGIECGEDAVVKVFFAQFIPNVLNRIQFWPPSQGFPWQIEQQHQFAWRSQDERSRCPVFAQAETQQRRFTLTLLCRSRRLRREQRKSDNRLGLLSKPMHIAPWDMVSRLREPP
jgi:hypothetical protein